MFIRLKTRKMDILKNVEQIDSIYKSTARKPMTAEELSEGVETKLPTIKIKFKVEVEGQEGIEISFNSEEERDEQFEKFASQLDARLFDGK